jgi:hypothetical protein
MPTEPILLVDLIYRNSRQQDLLLPEITRLVKLMYLSQSWNISGYGARGLPIG